MARDQCLKGIFALKSKCWARSTISWTLCGLCGPELGVNESMACVVLVVDTSREGAAVCGSGVLHGKAEAEGLLGRGSHVGTGREMEVLQVQGSEGKVAWRRFGRFRDRGYCSCGGIRVPGGGVTLTRSRHQILAELHDPAAPRSSPTTSHAYLVRGTCLVATPPGRKATTLWQPSHRAGRLAYAAGTSLALSCDAVLAWIFVRVADELFEILKTRTGEARAQLPLI